MTALTLSSLPEGHYNLNLVLSSFDTLTTQGGALPRRAEAPRLGAKLETSHGGPSLRQARSLEVRSARRGRRYEPAGKSHHRQMGIERGSLPLFSGLASVHSQFAEHPLGFALLPPSGSSEIGACGSGRGRARTGLQGGCPRAWWPPPPLRRRPGPRRLLGLSVAPRRPHSRKE